MPLLKPHDASSNGHPGPGIDADVRRDIRGTGPGERRLGGGRRDVHQCDGVGLERSWRVVVIRPLPVRKDGRKVVHQRSEVGALRDAGTSHHHVVVQRPGRHPNPLLQVGGLGLQPEIRSSGLYEHEDDASDDNGQRGRHHGLDQRISGRLTESQRGLSIEF